MQCMEWLCFSEDIQKGKMKDTSEKSEERLARGTKEKLSPLREKEANNYYRQKKTCCIMS